MIMPSSPDASRRSIGLGGASLAAIALCALTVSASPVHAKSDACRAGASALSDAKAIAGVRGAIARVVPVRRVRRARRPTKTHGKFVKCAKTVDRRTPPTGRPLLGAFTLRKECKSEVKKIYSKAACGYRRGGAARDVLRGEAGERQDEGEGAEGRELRRRAEREGRPACLLRVALRARRLQLRRHQLRAPCWSCRRRSNIPSGAQPANTPGTPRRRRSPTRSC